MVLRPLNVLLQCVIPGMSCTGGCGFWLRCKYSDPFRPSSLNSTGGSKHNMGFPLPSPPRPPSPGNLGRAPTSCAGGRACMRLFVCVSVFLWLCWRPCSGCGATTAMDPTRCVLSATPGPPPGPGSASNPEATSAAICGRIARTD